MKITTRFSFPLFLLITLSKGICLADAQNTTIPVNIGVILDLDALNGKMRLSCINMALSDFYASHDYYKTRLILHTRDSKSDVVGEAVAALYLMKNVEVEAIIGPQSSMHASFITDIGEKAQVPIISFSATSPSLTSLESSYFFRVAQNDSSEVKAISMIIQAFGWTEAVPIYIDNNYGQGIVPFLINALKEVDASVTYLSVIHPSATDYQLGQELYKLMTMQTRVFIVHMPPNLGSRLFTKAKEIGMMSEGYVWIITSGLANSFSSMDPSIVDSMQGVLGIKTYVPKTKALEDFIVRWKRKFRQDNPIFIDVELDVVGLWAYDAASALARAVEEVGTQNLGFEKTNVSSNLIDLDTIRVSLNGPRLREALSRTRFIGIAGQFGLVNGQLQSTTFEIINVNGNKERVVTFWTLENGFVRKLNLENTSTYSTSKNKLGPIIWPGDSSSIPKGSLIPTNRKKLLIGVPVDVVFKEFVNATHDPNTNTTNVSGYCIDIFNAVMKKLPYTVSYEFIPFAKPDGTSAGTYNDLVYQVFLQNFDAVVGDVTILANRSNFVDFTLPYTESGVSMVVPLVDRRKNAWVFLKPLTWDLWMTSGCFFVFIGFVVWLLEHRINDDFRGPPLHQIGTSLWFAFSTMVFAHREAILSNYTRFVVIIWVFVVLILTQSYTASLTSLLTVQNLQPTFTDVNQLIKKGEYVGYQVGSFVYEILIQMKFDKSKLKVYSSTDECDELLSKGSANGGIAAAFDEIPYVKLFLGEHCSKYTTAASIYKTDGFGFVFPRGSPLVAGVSRAILNVTEGMEMKDIENAWFGKVINCPNSIPQLTSDSLSLASFWGLFLIVGVASIAAIIFFVCVFFYKERCKILICFDSKGSPWRRIHHALRIFDRKDLSSHTFRRRGLQDESGIDNVHNIEPSSNTNNQSSPSSYSTHTDCHFAFSVDSGTFSREYLDLVNKSLKDNSAEPLKGKQQEDPAIEGSSTSTK